MPELTRWTARTTTTLLLGAISVPFATADVVHAQSAGAVGFDPARAFCERQTFELESLDEVAPWLDYVGGLRTGRSASPELECPSTTVRAVINIVSSPNVEIAEAQRASSHGFYTAKALQPESSERAIDTDGSFRYRNDITLAGFVWLLCPGTGEQRFACVQGVVGEFPADFVQTSPVFCDFAVLDEAKVERVPARVELPLSCAEGGTADPNVWMERTASVLGK